MIDISTIQEFAGTLRRVEHMTARQLSELPPQVQPFTTCYQDDGTITLPSRLMSLSTLDSDLKPELVIAALYVLAEAALRKIAQQKTRIDNQKIKIGTFAQEVRDAQRDADQATTEQMALTEQLEMLQREHQLILFMNEHIGRVTNMTGKLADGGIQFNAGNLTMTYNLDGTLDYWSNTKYQILIGTIHEFDPSTPMDDELNKLIKANENAGEKRFAKNLLNKSRYWLEGVYDPEWLATLMPTPEPVSTVPTIVTEFPQMQDSTTFGTGNNVVPLFGSKASAKTSPSGRIKRFASDRPALLPAYQAQTPTHAADLKSLARVMDKHGINPTDLAKFLWDNPKFREIVEEHLLTRS